MSEELTPVSCDEMLARIVKADLISIGETHEKGIEREFTRAFYDSLAAQKMEAEKCLVETYENLIGSNVDPKDPVRNAFDRVCPQGKIFDSERLDWANNHSKPLSRCLASADGKKVLTHNGGRHISRPSGEFSRRILIRAPIKLVKWIDYSKNGSISGRCPQLFSKVTRQWQAM